MPILPAHALTFSPPPRCPKCGVAIMPSRSDQLFAVDSVGRVYCREHASEIEPEFPPSIRSDEASAARYKSGG